MIDKPTMWGLPLPDGMTVKLSENDKKAEEVFNAVIDYTYTQVAIRMLMYGEPFEIALANHLEEIQNEGTPTG